MLSIVSVGVQLIRSLFVGMLTTSDNEKLVILWDLPGLVNVYITNWKITMFHGKSHYFYGD